MPKTLVVLTGPTGIGKTKLGIEIANHFCTEIVSGDSRQIFKEMSIGTAVPSAEELQQVHHHLIQSHSIRENYNASRYETEALEIIGRLFQQHDVVLLVGGSMLYIDAVCRGIDVMPDADPEIRKNLKQQLETDGIESLRLQLKKLDPDYYQTVDLKNPARIIHALEICLMTGKPYSSFRTNPQKERSFEILKIGLNTDRAILHQRINSRVDQMIAAGLIDEARALYPLKHLNALNTVGYRELFNWMDGNISQEKAIELIKRNSRRYARKQITWFKRDAEMQWFAPNESKPVIQYLEQQIGHKNEN